jgi:hypothetical protein
MTQHHSKALPISLVHFIPVTAEFNANLIACFVIALCMLIFAPALIQSSLLHMVSSKKIVPIVNCRMMVMRHHGSLYKSG